MNIPQPASTGGYCVGFLSGLTVGLAPALATWDGELFGLLPRVAIGLLTGFTGGRIAA